MHAPSFPTFGSLSIVWFLLLVLAGCPEAARARPRDAAADATEPVAPAMPPIHRYRADEGRWPFVVALRVDERAPACAGVVVAPRAVLTAATCVHQVAASGIPCEEPGAQLGPALDPSRVAVLQGDDPASAQPLAHGLEIVRSETPRRCNADLAVLLLDREVPVEPVAVLVDPDAVTPSLETVAVTFAVAGSGLAGRRIESDPAQIESLSTWEFTLGDDVCAGVPGGAVIDARRRMLAGVLSRPAGDCSATGGANVATRLDPWSSLLRRVVSVDGGTMLDAAVDAADATPPRPDADLPSDVAIDDVARVLPADFGAPCGDAAGCTSGYCVASSHVCTVLCDATSPCPAGYRCAPGAGGVSACFRTGR